MTTSIRETLAHLERRKISVAEYERMYQSGILGNAERLELLEGNIIQMSALGNMHIRVMTMLNALFIPLYLERKAIIGPQHALRLARSVPQPDLVLLRHNTDMNGDMQNPANVLLVVEVSDSTLDKDVKIKTRVYADANIPEYWIIDINGEAVLQYSQPQGKAFRAFTRNEKADTLTSVIIPTFSVQVVEIFGTSLPALKHLS